MIPLPLKHSSAVVGIFRLSPFDHLGESLKTPILVMQAARLLGLVLILGGSFAVAIECKC